MKLTARTFLITILLIAGVTFLNGCGGSSCVSTYQQQQQAQLADVKPGKFDGGKMWTFDVPPVDYLNETYGFKPDQQWLDDVRLSALRFGGGCTASFVSADGLVMTNHHCARGSAMQVQKAGEKLFETGFYAAKPDDERKVPNLSVDQLVEIRDISKEVHAAMDAAKTDEERLKARTIKTTEIEKKLGEETKNRVQIVSLYNGGKYSAYVYKRYTDVRLVFLPELKMAHFGAEFDNFTYPRYAMDCSFFRVYDENGKPLRTEHYYKWSRTPVKEGELTFVVGNPGSTSRLSTIEQLEYNRDVQYPVTSQTLDDRAEILMKYMELHPEKKEQTFTQLLGVSNSQKSYKGRLDGLRNDVLMARRRAFDKEFRSKVEAKPELKSKYGKVWDEIAETRAKLRSVSSDMFGLRMGGMGSSEFMSKAYLLVRYMNQTAKPEDKRDKAYRDSALQYTKRTVLSYPKPDRDMEFLVLTKQLMTMKRMLGADDPIMKFALQGQSCEEAAKRLIGATTLGDSLAYGALAQGGQAAVEASNDPFVTIVRMAYPRLEKVIELQKEISDRDQVNRTLLGRAQFEVYGTQIPPDATFTLRLADGVVKGYEYNGTKAPAFTTIYGLYDRHYSFPDDPSWALADPWLKAPADLDLSTPYNISTTNDIIGGNSGSAMINKNKEVVGLVFDGNMESLPGDFIFAEDMGNRTVSVHASGIMAALRHVYKAQRVVQELTSGKMAQ
jgi:hypothetical protein